MSDPRAVGPAIDLFWSLWTELGVPGPWRRHEDCVIDPEPLILYTSLGRDARLDGLVLAWCEQHGERISATRLNGLYKRSSEATQIAYGPLGSAMALTRVGKSWPAPRESSDARLLPAPRELSHPAVDRRSLVAFRVRALVGVGARADVLTRLLAERGWTSSSHLDDLGYTRRNIDRVIAELVAGGIVEPRGGGAAREVRLSSPSALAQVVGARAPLRVISWSAVFALIELATQLSGDRSKPVTRQIVAGRWRRAALDIAKRLDIPGPAPVPWDIDDPWGELEAWSRSTLEAIANGTSAAFRAVAME